MAKLVLVGSSPSSGSTMLADILDSSHFSCCGPELEIFCNKALYGSFKTNELIMDHQILSLRATGIFPKWALLNDAYGLSKNDFKVMINESESFNSFQEKFAEFVLEHRNKSLEGILFEKTPQNLNAVGEFLNQTEDSYFLCVVRNPLYVINSLLNRGWDTYSALATWLIYASQTIQYKEHSRFKIIALEDLVKTPFQIAANIINEISDNHCVGAKQMKIDYHDNDFRDQFVTKISSWEANQQGAKKIINPNAKKVKREVREVFSKGLKMSISKQYAMRYGILQISYEEALQELGYGNIIDDFNLFAQTETNRINVGVNERLRFLRKAVRVNKTISAISRDYEIFSQALTS